MIKFLIYGNDYKDTKTTGVSRRLFLHFPELICCCILFRSVQNCDEESCDHLRFEKRYIVVKCWKNFNALVIQLIFNPIYPCSGNPYTYVCNL